MDDPWSETDAFESSQIKIRVQQADGQYRGTLFKDGPWHRNRWSGAPKPGLQEDMICDGPLLEGPWLLIEYVLPRQIIGEAARDSLFDEASTCCRRTPVQALHWFSQQAFGPPPALVERVRQFARDWTRFRESESAKSLLHTVVSRALAPAADLISGPQTAADLELLQRLGLVHPRGGTEERFSADSIVKNMGVAGYIAWMSSHLDRVAGWTSPKNRDDDVQKLDRPTFYDLAVATLERAKSIVLFRAHRSLHPRWKVLASQVPQQLRDVVDEYHRAQTDESQARIEHARALQGTPCNDPNVQAKRDHERTVQALAEGLQQAQARTAKALADVRKIELELVTAENGVAERWLRAQAAEFLQTRDAFAAAFLQHQHEVESLCLEPFILNEWKGTAACSVLLDIANQLAQTLGGDCRSADWLVHASLFGELQALSQENWRDLEIAVRKEGAAVTRGVAQATQPGVGSDARTLSQTPQPTSGGDIPCFLRRGDAWHLRFEGCEAHVKHTKGMQHIADLIQQQGKPVSALELDRLSPDAVESRQDVLDKDALKDLWSERNRITQQIEECHDDAELGELQEDLEKVKAELGRATRGGVSEERCKRHGDGEG